MHAFATGAQSMCRKTNPGTHGPPFLTYTLRFFQGLLADPIPFAFHTFSDA